MAAAVGVVTKPAPDTLPESSAPLDLEKASSAAGATATAERPGSRMAAVMRRWRREDLLDRSPLLLRAATWLFSFISAVVMATNRHGDWSQFYNYEEYRLELGLNELLIAYWTYFVKISCCRYLLAIAALAFLYSTVQLVRQVYRLTGRKDSNRPVPKKAAFMVDFVGDQVIAYLLISALSAAIPITNSIRGGTDNTLTDSSAASISMAFLAFVTLALSALISGFRLSKQTYI
ncbi:CASP-like protein 4B4 isoform X1 [Typha latifolia]|uniref:CASP-like protein 4B4 isoform X1 n=1 Tax=Typha latifolia TaxID=4733 RepID=UPI003C2D2E70